jgi:hypothetical protein
LSPESRSKNTGIVRATRVAIRADIALTTAATGAAAAPVSCMSTKRPNRRTAGASARAGAASFIRIRDARRADSGPAASEKRTPMSSGASSSSIRVPDLA